MNVASCLLVAAVVFAVGFIAGWIVGLPDDDVVPTPAERVEAERRMAEIQMTFVRQAAAEHMRQVRRDALARQNVGGD
jgi:uncharacterized membrane protein YciS (DUF1049 family)